MTPLTPKMEELCATSRWDFSDLRAVYINCTLNRSPEISHTQGLADRSIAIMERNGVTVEQFRAIDEDFRQLEHQGVYDALMKIPANLLSDRSYWAGVTLDILRDGKEYILVNYNAISFMAYSSDEAKVARAQKPGLISPRLEWSIEKVDNAA